MKDGRCATIKKKQLQGKKVELWVAEKEKSPKTNGSGVAPFTFQVDKILPEQHSIWAPENRHSH